MIFYDNIFVSYYILAMKCGHRDPKFAGVAAVFASQVILLYTAYAILQQFFVIQEYSFWRSKGFLYSVAGLTCVAVILYFRGAAKKDRAIERFFSYSKATRVTWEIVAAAVFVGPIIGICLY